MQKRLTLAEDTWANSRSRESQSLVLPVSARLDLAKGTEEAIGTWL